MDSQLAALHRKGARGIRFNMNCGYKGDWEEIRRLVERVAEYGWCVCLWMDPDLLVEKRTFSRICLYSWSLTIGDTCLQGQGPVIPHSG